MQEKNPAFFESVYFVHYFKIVG